MSRNLCGKFPRGTCKSRTNRLDNVRYSFQYNEFFALYEEDYTEADIEEYVESCTELDSTQKHNLKLAIRTA